MKEKYSKEWNDLYKSANTYQNYLKSFLSKESKINDLKFALKDFEAAYYALKVIENLDKNDIYKLLDDLIYVVVYNNTSNSFFAKRIITNSTGIIEFRKDLYNKILEYSFKEKDNIYIIKDIAQFLYELRYKRELIDFINKNEFALKESEFIENNEDLEDIYNMIDIENIS